MTATSDADIYFRGLKHELRAAGNAQTGAQMSRYLRDQFSCLGVKAPLRRAIQKQYRDRHGELVRTSLRAFVQRCWKDPNRELQYTAIDLAIRERKHAPENFWKLYESMITQKSWWDTVDPVATTLVTTHLQRYENLNPELPDRWIESSNIWLQRTALLFQLKYKKSTNAGQLFRYIDAVRDSEEFFLQKAAGWALREYSRHEPMAVEEYVRTTTLSALTVREGMRLINSR